MRTRMCSGRRRNNKRISTWSSWGRQQRQTCERLKRRDIRISSRLSMLMIVLQLLKMHK